MATSTKKERERDSKAGACLPCDIPAFCRNNYFTGKLLTERDLTAEQRYFIDKLRLHHVALHGWGVVCGLRVRPHEHCPDLRIVIEPGLAIDGCGREILVNERIEVDLPRPPAPPPAWKDPCPPDEVESGDRYPTRDESPAQQEPSVAPKEPVPAEQESRHDPEQGRYVDRHGKDESRKDGGWAKEPPRHRPPHRHHNLYLCVRYVECETEFRPAPYDECGCGSDEKRPNRICEGYRFELEWLEHAPPDWKHVRECAAEEPDECEDIYGELLNACPAPGSPACIPLAVIHSYEPGDGVTDDMIDNRSYRRLLPSTRILDRLIRCILDKLPTTSLTRIEDTGWQHGGEYSWSDFWKLFIGDDSDPQAFEITFDDTVRPEGLSEYTFQAVAVRHTGRGHRSGHLEQVPATVWASGDRRRFYLRPEPDWLHDCRGHSMELYFTLRGDLIVDDRGRPVDAELQAEIQSDGDYAVVFPTGNGIPGGRFESWIRILPEPRRGS